jgi:hypothetical protein
MALKIVAIGILWILCVSQVAAFDQRTRRSKNPHVDRLLHSWGVYDTTMGTACLGCTFGTIHI